MIVTAVDNTACHSVNHTTSQVWDRPRVSAIAVPLERLDDQRRERPDVEHRECHDRHDREHRDEPPRQPVHPSTSSVHSSIQMERLASITAGSSERDTSGTTAWSTNSCGRSTAWFVG